MYVNLSRHVLKRKEIKYAKDMYSILSKPVNKDPRSSKCTVHIVNENKSNSLGMK